MELTKLKAFQNGKLDNLKELPGFQEGLTANANLGAPKGFYNATNPNSVQNQMRALNQKLTYNQPLIQNGPTAGNTTKGITQADSAASGIGPWFAAGLWAGGGVAEGISRIKSADEHLADAGTSQANINGISYTQQNSVDAGSIMSQYDKDTATDFFTNPFRGIASLFGRSKAEREAKNAATYANIQQNAARDTAYSQYLRLDNAKKYGDIQDQVLYAKDGKLPNYHEGLVSGEANARVSSGEFIAREVTPGQFIGYRVPGLKNNKDGRLAHLEPEDYVISNKNGASDIAASGDIIGAINHMIATGNPSYKCGKLPGHAEGWLGNFIPSALGGLASLDQMFQAYRNKPYRPNTYAANPYETEGLSTLAGLRVNPYPIMNQLRSAEARTNRAIDIAGGLSGSQRTAARLANLNTTQNNISNLLSNIQQQNNAYKSTYAQAAINAGQSSREARMKANQWDLDYYSKAHAARNRGIQTGIANMLSQIQQYQANEFKRRQFNETMDLYRADQKQRRDQFDQYRNTMANINNTTTQTRGVAPNPIKQDPVNPYTPIAPEPIRKYPWQYNKPEDYWYDFYSKRGGIWG